MGRKRHPRPLCPVCKKHIVERPWQTETCGRSCGNSLRAERYPEQIDKTMAIMARVRRKNYLASLAAEFKGIVADKPTFTRVEVVRLLISQRQRWIRVGYKREVRAYRKQPKGRAA